MTLPVSIRFNNPGALNTAKWVQALPGYLSAVETTPGNSTAHFDTPEHGVAAWWELLRRYRVAGVTTVGSIITRYGGGQDYSIYLSGVCKRSGLLRSTVISLDDDAALLKLAKAMFWYEAGVATPLTDAQIIKGFNIGRELAGEPAGEQQTEPPDDDVHTWRDNLPLVVKWVLALIGRWRDGVVRDV
jgi:hypothetical protein